MIVGAMRRTFRMDPLDALWVLLGGLLVAVLVEPPDVTGESLGLRRHLTPPVSEEWRVAQRFRMNAPDLNAIELQPETVGPVRGTYLLTVRDRDARGVERITEVKAEDLVRDDSFVYRFETIEDSEGHEFEFEIASVPDDPGSGVALWATKGERAEGAAMRINNEARWGSLAYQAHTPVVSPLRSLLSPGDAARPPRWLGLVGVVGLWLSLRFVFRSAARLFVPANGSAPAGDALRV